MYQNKTRLFTLFLVVAIVVTSSMVMVSAQQDEGEFTPGEGILSGLRIYFTEAQGEASRFDRSPTGLSRFAGLVSQLGAELLTLEWRTGFPDDADMIIIAGPTNDFTPDQTARLWSYLNNNGRLLFLSSPNTTAQKGLPATNQLFNLMWTDMGVRVRDDVVVTEGDERPVAPTPTATPEEESEEGEESEAGNIGGVVLEPMNISGPSLITAFITRNVEEHPVTKGIEALSFFGARSVEADASLQVFEVTPLVRAGTEFYGEAEFNLYLDEGTVQYNIGIDTTRGPLVLASAFDNPETGSRLVLIGNREFATNGGGLLTSPPNSASFLYPDNAQFLLNAVTWLLETDDVEMTFPTPGPTPTVTITPTPTMTPTPEVTPTPTSEDAGGNGA